MKEIHRVRVWNKKGVESSTEELPGGLRAARGHSPPLSKEAPDPKPNPNPRGGPGFKVKTVLSCLLTLYTSVR